MLRELYEAPWKGWNELRRWLLLPYIRLLFQIKGVPWETDWRIYGVPIIQRHRHSTLTIGRGLQLRSSIQSNPLAPYHPVVLSTRHRGSQLIIGDRVGITGGTLCAAEHIQIGDRTLIGANSIVVDTDFHPLAPTERTHHHANIGKCAPVIIEDDVFIGMNCLILKGTHLGHGCVVGAGSVVSQDVPPKAIVAGNPARLIGEVT